MTRHRFSVLAGAALGLLLSIFNATSAQPNMELAQAPTTGLAPMTFADLERLYLDGKISAKQYQKMLNELKSRPVQPVQPAVPVEKSPLPPVTPHPTTPPVTIVTPTTLPPVASQTNKSDQITAVETKMDELLRAKAAREKAATNAPSVTTSTGPKSKRDRLNDLLRLYIEGKITEPEMNERRAKIISEPE